MAAKLAGCVRHVKERFLPSQGTTTGIYELRIVR